MVPWLAFQLQPLNLNASQVVRTYVSHLLVGIWLIFYKFLAVNIPMGPLQFLRDLVDKI